MDQSSDTERRLPSGRARDVWVALMVGIASPAKASVAGPPALGEIGAEAMEWILGPPDQCIANPTQ